MGIDVQGIAGANAMEDEEEESEEESEEEDEEDEEEHTRELQPIAHMRQSYSIAGGGQSCRSSEKSCMHMSASA